MECRILYPDIGRKMSCQYSVHFVTYSSSDRWTYTCRSSWNQKASLTLSVLCARIRIRAGHFRVYLWIEATPKSMILFEPTCAYCTVGSYAALSVRLSVCPSGFTQGTLYTLLKIHISEGIMTGWANCQRQVAFLNFSNRTNISWDNPPS